MADKAKRPKFLLLWHPDSPGMKVPVRRRWLRRRSDFATLADLGRYYAARELVDAMRGNVPVENRCV